MWFGKGSRRRYRKLRASYLGSRSRLSRSVIKERAKMSKSAVLKNTSTVPELSQTVLKAVREKGML